MTQVSSTSSSKPGSTIKGLLCALAVLLLIELLGPASLRGKPPVDGAALKRNCDVLIVGDSRTEAISPEMIAQAWTNQPEVGVFSSVGAHIESASRFAMSRQVTPPRMLVMCVSYSGYYSSPHGTNSRLNRLSDYSPFVSWKNWVRETTRARSLVYLDKPFLSYVEQLRSWVKNRGTPKASPSPTKMEPESVDESVSPVLPALDLMIVHNVYERKSRRVVPSYRDRQFESILETWKSQGTKIVFLRLPVSGELKVLENNSPFLGILQPLAERHQVPFIDLNTFEWGQELQQFMPDQSHVWGQQRRLKMSQRIGELLYPLDPAAH